MKAWVWEGTDKVRLERGYPDPVAKSDTDSESQ